MDEIKRLRRRVLELEKAMDEIRAVCNCKTAWAICDTVAPMQLDAMDHNADPE